MDPIYLDYNATTPIIKEVADAMSPFLKDYFGNPSSVHSFGTKTRNAVNEARKKVSDLLNAGVDEIIFTSGGTESNNMAIKGIALERKEKGNHIITSSIEHPAVTEVCKYLESIGFSVTYLSVDKDGIVDLDELKSAIRPETILISIMHANNEIGTIQPLREISEIAHKRGILLHSDAAQSVGKVKTDVVGLGVDLLSVAGHKLYAPKGIGALYVKRGIRLEKLIHGADHEQNFRAGTENVLEITGLGKACEIANRDLEKNHAHCKQLRDKLQQILTEEFNDVRINGHQEFRLPNTLSISFPNVDSNTLIAAMEGVAVSAGAACHSEDIYESSVLKAIDLPQKYVMGTIRISTGVLSTEKEIRKAADIIIDNVNKLRGNEISDHRSSEESNGNDLTQFTHGLGCACKLSPELLDQVLKDLETFKDKDLIIGNSTSDDAAVYKIDQNTAIVKTVDFFTPVVDSPYDFGAIATANALSDIYAMGAKPLLVLNIVAFPTNRLPISVLKEILKGASDKAIEAEVSIAGGHSIEDPEPKFGMAVTGIVHPDKVLSNSNAQPGDALVLTKPLGSGIITTSIKRKLATQEVRNKAIQVMSELNKKAAGIMKEFPVNACTDVTGFGLLGHLSEMIRHSKVEAVINAESVPLLEGVKELAVAGIIPGGTKNNMNYVSDAVNWGEGISYISKVLLCDAQTSGGLLISLPEQSAEQLVKKLKDNGIYASSIIGRIDKNGKGMIYVK